jgi:hypothetical protein
MICKAGTRRFRKGRQGKLGGLFCFYDENLTAISMSLSEQKCLEKRMEYAVRHAAVGWAKQSVPTMQRRRKAKPVRKEH